MKGLFQKSFEFYDRHGLGLEDQHILLIKQDPNIRIDLFQFAMDAAKSGWSNEKIKTTIDSYVRDFKLEIYRG